MNPCILVTSHLNNSEKVKIAQSCVDFLQDKGLPTIFAGNFPIPLEIQQKVDYTLNIKENPRCNRYNTFWNLVDPKIEWGGNLCAEFIEWDYGYAHLHQILKAIKLCQSLGYDYVYHLNYDIVLSEENFYEFISRGKSGDPLFFPWGDHHNFATNIFALSCNTYINSVEPVLDLYKEGIVNDPNLKEGWFCESFFKWSIEKYLDQKFLTIKDIPFSGIYETFNAKYIIGQSFVSIYFYPKKDLYLVWVKEGTLPNLCNLEHEDGSTHLLEPTPVPNYFILNNSKEGSYYYKKDLVFTDNSQFRESNYIIEK